jgi:hypothetical protein
MAWYDDRITVKNATVLPPEIACRRKPLGGAQARKPNLTRFPDGELLLTCFHDHYEPHEDGWLSEHIMLYRSLDGGQTWEARHCDHLWGKEPYLNLFRDGTLVITTHHLAEEVRNRTGQCLAVLHRSTDRGRTWESHTITTASVPDDVGMTYSSRNIIELEDGALLMGLGCGHGNDYMCRSLDRGKTWTPQRTVFHGYDQRGYAQSPYWEGYLWVAGPRRLFMLARCAPGDMGLTEEIEGLPNFDWSSGSGLDQFEIEILFESNDDGLTWYPRRAINLLSVMYPSVTALPDGQTLLTFTVRTPNAGNHMGVQAMLLGEDADGVPCFDLTADRIVIDEKTPDCLQTGGGFGNTISLGDGWLLSTYSYYDADEDVRREMEDGSYCADEERFEALRRRAALIYQWAEPDNFTWAKLKDKNDRLRRHCYLGCCEVLRKARSRAEIVMWQLGAGAPSGAGGASP